MNMESKANAVDKRTDLAEEKRFLAHVGKEEKNELPPVVSLAEYREKMLKLSDELIEGVLRVGHKMLISGPSKAGKSFLLMELCIAIAEGTKWMGFQCKKGRVLYINLEIDKNSCINRFMEIYETLGLTECGGMENIDIWNLRGHAVPLNELVPKLIEKAKGQHYDAIILDPIYKVITGDENNASEMARFCNQFDKICTATGCAAIYCHHHSKGAQGAKRAMDRASGSGVFARDPDAQLDIIQLELPDEVKVELKDSKKNSKKTAWRVESNLREFPNIEPVNMWFDYPIHYVESDGKLDNSAVQGSFQAARNKNSKNTTKASRKEDINRAYQACLEKDPMVTVKAMAKYLNVTERCIRDRLTEMSDTYYYKNGVVRKISAPGQIEGQ